MFQTTIKRSFPCQGIGLHSGREVSLTAEPAQAESGIVFELITQNGIRRILPRPDAVIATALATTLGEGEARLSTVEHLLAAVRGLGIDNIIFRIAGNEAPVLDGSASLWVELIKKAGITCLPSPRRVLRLVRPVELVDGDKFIRAIPHDGFFVDYTIDFAHPVIGRQRFCLEIDPHSFEQIASARTFGFYEEVEYMRKKGLALGGSLDNAVVLDSNGVINPEGLRFTDEFVRHKMLDFVGDMAMLPLPLQGRFEVFRSGHDLNNKLLHALLAENALEEIVLNEVGMNEAGLDEAVIESEMRKIVFEGFNAPGTDSIIYEPSLAVA